MSRDGGAMKHTVKFIPSGRGKAQCPANPDFPNGIDINATTSPEQPSCKVDLPYPSPECGLVSVRCSLCRTSVLLTAAGRPDDPKSVTIPCNSDAMGAVN